PVVALDALDDDAGAPAAVGPEDRAVRELRRTAAEELQAAIARLTLENVLARPLRREGEAFQRPEAWTSRSAQAAARAR
ncbi:hypothetical protein R0J90_23465, partial [Micrococcus sp. SIMBA_144]